MSRSRSPTPRADRKSRSRSASRSRSPSPRPDRRDDKMEERRPRDEHRGRDERRSRQDDAGESNSVLVRNLNYRTHSDELKKVFGAFGDVTDVYLPLDYNTKRPRGFGFVQFKSSDDAHAACKALDHTEVDGNQVEVVIAKQNRKSPGTMRKFGGRNDRSDYGRSRRGDSRDRHSRRSRSRSDERRYDDRRDRRRERY